MIKEVSTAVKEDQLKKEAKMQKELMKHCPTLKSVREKQEKGEKVTHAEIQQMIKEVKALGPQGEKGKEMTSARSKRSDAGGNLSKSVLKKRSCQRAGSLFLYFFKKSLTKSGMPSKINTLKHN